MKRLSITIVALFFASMVTAGCNTTKGAGKDLERGGEKIQDSAERHGAH